MPYADKEKAREHHNAWRKAKRRERGLQKPGPKPLSEEDKLLAFQKRKEYEFKWNQAHPYSTRDKRSKLLWAAKRRSKQQNTPFNLTIDDIIIPEYCPYLGTKLEDHATRYSNRDSIASLDKIIPELGYVQGNIEIMSHKANSMKNNASIEELINFAKEILKRYD